MATRMLICGATGFIGRNLVERFAPDPRFAVTAVCNRVPRYDAPRLRWENADLLRPEDVDRVVADQDVVVQAAATTSGARDIVERPFIHVCDNAVMNSLLLRAAYNAGVGQFVFFSCSVMYPSSECALKESDFDGSTGIRNEYFGAGWTKVYVEQMCRFYSGLGRTRHTVVRHSNVYGPHDKFDLERSHVFGATVTKVMAATTGEIAVWGDGTEKRDLLFVDDLCDFVAAAIERQESPFELCNVGSGRPLPVIRIVEEIIRASGREIGTRFDRGKPTIPASIQLDCSLAAERFGWTAKTALEAGVDRTLQWYRRNYGG